MPGSDSTPGGSATAAITNLTVRLFSQYAGRGPTRARIHVNENLLTIVLQDNLTKAEQTAGQAPALTDRRCVTDASR